MRYINVRYLLTYLLTHIHNDSSAVCTFLDASKAFDRVRYCKLFRILISRNITACIVRVLIQTYTRANRRVFRGLVYFLTIFVCLMASNKAAY